jgi:hypothetical protein
MMTPLVAPVVLTALLTAAVLMAIVAASAIDQSQRLRPAGRPARKLLEAPLDQRGSAVYECSTDDDYPDGLAPDGLVHQLIVCAPIGLWTSPAIVQA